MVNPSAWEPPHLPPLEPDEFVPADGQAPSSFNSPPHYRVPTLTPPFPEYPGFPPASAHGNGDFTAGAVFDFIDTSAGGFEDSLWTDDINFDGAGLESLDLRSASTPLDLEFSHHHHQHDLNPALGTIPFHPAPRGSHGTHHSAADLLLEFERRVSALLDPLPGMTAPEGDLEIECLDTEQEHILMRISRERGRAIRFEPSRYPKRSRVAIIPGYTPYSGPGPPISSSFQASGPPTWPASHTSPHPSSGTTRSGALSAPPRPKELGVAGPSTPQIANPNRNPPPPSGTTSTHKPKASGKDPVARPPSSAASTRPSVRRSPSTETIAPKASHSRSIKQRLLRASKSSRESRDADKTREACWACRVMRKKCDPSTPCKRCAVSSHGSDTAQILCRRGLVCDLTAIPILCPLLQVSSQEQQQRSSQSPPPTSHRTQGPEGAALEKVHRAFDLAKERRHHDVYEAKAFGRTTSDDDPYRRILLKVATTDIKDLRGFVYNLGNDRFAYDFPYDALILKIVWELVDNRAAAKIIGIEDAEDLVAMLESASRCEAKFRKWETKRRLVYSAMNCLKDCLEAIRLCTSEPSLLTTAAHAHCTSAECTSPGLDGLSKRLPKYADFLTSALLRKKRDEDDDWLVVFYSLCIQGYIRRGLVELERCWRACPGSDNAEGSEAEMKETVLGCRDYLHTAVTLFLQISAQNKGKLALQITKSPAQPSAYVGVSSLSSLSTLPVSQSVPTPKVLGSWDQWRDEGVEKHLRRIFEMDDYAPIQTPDQSDDPYDSDTTMTVVSGTVIGSRRNRISNGSLQQLNPSKRVQLTVPVPVPVYVPKRDPSPSLSSRYSMTSLGDESELSSLADASNASTLSFSTFNSFNSGWEPRGRDEE